jgi:hypothetical protein
MAEEPIDGVAVLRGDAMPGLRWTVSVDASEGHLMVMLNGFRGDRHLAGSGFDGTKFFGGRVLQEWRGRTDDLPFFVMARTAGAVIRVVARWWRPPTWEPRSTSHCRRSSPSSALGSRRRDCPRGERPCTIRAERDGVVIDTARQPVPDFPPPTGSS